MKKLLVVLLSIAAFSCSTKKADTNKNSLSDSCLHHVTIVMTDTSLITFVDGKIVSEEPHTFFAKEDTTLLPSLENCVRGPVTKQSIVKKKEKQSEIWIKPDYIFFADTQQHFGTIQPYYWDETDSTKNKWFQNWVFDTCDYPGYYIGGSVPAHKFYKIENDTIKNIE